MATIPSAPRSLADDANTIFVRAWGAGVTNLRVGWNGDVGSMQLAPFLGREQSVGSPVHRVSDPERCRQAE